MKFLSLKETFNSYPKQVIISTSNTLLFTANGALKEAKKVDK